MRASRYHQYATAATAAPRQEPTAPNQRMLEVVVRSLLSTGTHTVQPRMMCVNVCMFVFKCKYVHPRGCCAHARAIFARGVSRGIRYIQADAQTRTTTRCGFRSSDGAQTSAFLRRRTQYVYTRASLLSLRTCERKSEKELNTRNEETQRPNVSPFLRSLAIDVQPNAMVFYNRGLTIQQRCKTRPKKGL